MVPQRDHHGEIHGNTQEKRLSRQNENIYSWDDDVRYVISVMCVSFIKFSSCLFSLFSIIFSASEISSKGYNLIRLIHILYVLSHSLIVWDFRRRLSHSKFLTMRSIHLIHWISEIHWTRFMFHVALLIWERTWLFESLFRFCNALENSKIDCDSFRIRECPIIFHLSFTFY